jgi:hypothetical protein
VGNRGIVWIVRTDELEDHPLIIRDIDTHSLTDCFYKLTRTHAAERMFLTLLRTYNLPAVMRAEFGVNLRDWSISVAVAK